MGLDLVKRAALDRSCHVERNMSDTIDQLQQGDDPDGTISKQVKNTYNNLFDILMGVDPTPDQQSSYLPWIIRIYIHNGIRLWEDLGRTKAALEQYHGMKTRRVFQNSNDPKIKKAGDINQFKSLSDLESFIRELLREGGDQSIADRNFIKKLSEFISDGGVSVEKISNDYTKGIIKLKSYEASSILFKQRTSWCTTTSESLFSDYSPLVVYYDLNTDYYEQISLDDFSHMDKHDKPFDNLKSAKLYDYIKQYVNQDPWDCIDQSPSAIRYIDNPSKEVQMAAVQQIGYAIDYIKNPAKEVQMTAVRDYGDAIRFIDNPSEEVQMAAVQQDGYAIRFIENPSEEVKMAAVQEDGYAIQFIKNPSEELQMATVQQSGSAIRFIKNPSEELKMIAAQNDGNAIEYIENPSESVQLVAVQQDGYAIQYIKNPHPSVVKYVEDNE